MKKIDYFHQWTHFAVLCFPQSTWITLQHLVDGQATYPQQASYNDIIRIEIHLIPELMPVQGFNNNFSKKIAQYTCGGVTD